MTDEDIEIENALRKCAGVRLPDDFADRLVERVRASGEREEKSKSRRSVLVRIALIAASLALLLGFAPVVLDRVSDSQTQAVAHVDEIRAVKPTLPQDIQLNALAFLGFCREVIRRRARTFFARGRKREEEE